MNNFKFLKDKRKNITEVSLVCALTMSMVLSSCSANFVNNNITSETS